MPPPREPLTALPPVCGVAAPLPRTPSSCPFFCGRDAQSIGLPLRCRGLPSSSPTAGDALSAGRCAGCCSRRCHRGCLFEGSRGAAAWGCTGRGPTLLACETVLPQRHHVVFFEGSLAQGFLLWLSVGRGSTSRCPHRRRDRDGPGWSEFRDVTACHSRAPASFATAPYCRRGHDALSIACPRGLFRGQSRARRLASASGCHAVSAPGAPQAHPPP